MSSKGQQGIFTISFQTDPEVHEKQNEDVDFETAIALTGYGKFNYLLLAVAVPCAMVSVFDTTTMAYILPLAQCDLQLSDFDKGALNAITYAGMITSAFLWGFLSDTLGRHRLLVVGYFLDGIMGILSSFAQSLWLMLFLRYWVGFMICGPYAVLMTYLAEFHGAKYRSRIIMFTGVSVSMGNFLLPGIALLMLTNTWQWNMFDGYIQYKSWNTFVFVCSLPAILSACCIMFFGESPKFLMSQGRRDEAMEIFKYIYSMNTREPPDTYPVTSLHDETACKQENHTESGIMGHWKAFKSGLDQIRPLFLLPHLPKAILVFSIQVGCLFSMNTIRLWIPQIFATIENYVYLETDSNNSTASATLCEMLTFVASFVENATSSEQNLTMIQEDTDCVEAIVNQKMYINSIIVGATSFMSYLSASYIVKWIDKRKLMVVFYLLAGTCGISVLWINNGNAIIAIMSMYLAFIGVTSTAILGVVVDTFPTTLRTMAVSLTMMFGRMGSLCGNLIFPVLLGISCDLPFILVSAVAVGSSLASFLLPKTKGKALE